MTYNLNIYTSNRMEVLAEILARIVKEPLPSPLLSEVVVVQSRGMARWVSMELARHNGICANCTFPFPNTFLKEIVQKTLSDFPDESFFDPANMTFAIMKILPECLQLPGFEGIHRYLSEDTNHLKLYQISLKIADLFDQYLVFRPDMIFQWDEGKEDHWQANLWRKLSYGKETSHRAWLRRALIQKLEKEPLSINDFPDRVSIFGISYLPPFYLDVFAEISRVTQVNLFIMNPCEAYWADIVSDREIKKIQEKYSYEKDTAETLFLEMGNRLLASMGLMGKHFLAIISGLQCRTYEQFEAYDEKTILSKIQSDILQLKDRKARDANGLDTSVQMHACHSPMREIEILHDNLLAMFEERPDLLPKDIVVMTPDIESYAPFIQAVFDAQTDSTLRIPFTIADQNIKKEGRVIDGFMSILDLKKTRLGSAQIMKLLEFPGIKKTFGMTESDVEMIEHWIRKTNIRWGQHAEHRRELGLPAISENTWQAGIERLLLGYAMPGYERRMFSGILPYDHIEGGDAKILGKLLEFLDPLFAYVDSLNTPRTLHHWHAKLIDILEQFFAPDEATAQEIQVLHRIVDTLPTAQELSGFAQPIDIDVIRSYVDNLLEYEHFGTGFITGGVTFCAMLPMRSIPFKVICLIGMNSDAFPRESKKLSFDLMAKKPKIGDRSRRNDDKYLFLEALISARNALYISYVGQSIQDNSKIPPSVLVSQLIDYIREGFGLSEDQLITYHKLQAFSSEYFKEGRLFSYSRENLAACREKNTPKAVPLLPDDPLPEPALKWKTLDIKDLSQFFNNPARFFLERRLGVYLYETMEVPDERENFIIDPLIAYQMGQDMVKNRLSGSDLKDLLPQQKALGRLPHGRVGDVVYSSLGVDADAFARKLEKHLKGRPLKHIDVDFDIAGFKLVGRIDAVWEQGLSLIQYSKIKPKYLLKSWIYHLILCSLVEANLVAESYLICKDATWTFGTVSASRDMLQALLDLFWIGMSKPLHFFPEASYAYAQKVLLRGQSKGSALKTAKNKWVGSEFARGESADPYFERCFGKTDPLDEAFQSIAMQIFSPLLAHGKKIII
ncbi:MAG: exodeoxyribonuclease V subunit gamma [Desulfobacterales bacterium]|nr:MAG: exodeoxyribonuclease V subunit gamma [Desulfobacterales bacterium]